MNKWGIQLPDRVENIVGKGEIACYKQILLFPQCFTNCLLLMRQNEFLWIKGLFLEKKKKKTNIHGAKD